MIALATVNPPTPESKMPMGLSELTGLVEFSATAGVFTATF